MAGKGEREGGKTNSSLVVPFQTSKLSALKCMQSDQMPAALAVQSIPYPPLLIYASQMRAVCPITVTLLVAW